MPNKTPVSVLILTKNEERNIAECIESVLWADEVKLLDSYSEDRTLEIAEKFQIPVVQRTFDNFSTHKNWVLDHVSFKHPWLLFLDADERITPELAAEIEQVLKTEPVENGYYIARKNYFCGKWIKHGGWYPDWNMRFVRVGKARYEDRIVHEHMLVEGEPGYFKAPLIHYDFKGIERYIDRHNHYSSLEAVECYKVLQSEKTTEQLKPHFLGKGPSRRRYLKQLAYRYLPCRPLFKFLWMYVFKLGFLDGKMGFRYSLLHAIYEYQINLKLEELKQPNSPMQEKYRQYL